MLHQSKTDGVHTRPGTCTLGQLYLLKEYIFIFGWLDKVDLHGPGRILLASYCTSRFHLTKRLLVLRTASSGPIIPIRVRRYLRWLGLIPASLGSFRGATARRWDFLAQI
jgi:hypothetical protein